MGDLDSVPGLRRSPGGGNSYPLQDSGLENSMDCIVHGVAKSQTRLSDFHFQEHYWAAQVTLVVNNPPASVGDFGDSVSRLWVEKIPLEEGMTNHSSILVWRIPWTEEPGGPQFTGLQRVGHNKLLSKHALESIIALTTRPVGSPKVHPTIQGCPQRPDSLPHYTLSLPVCR